MSHISGIDHIALLVSDRERALAFFRDLLGFKVKFDFAFDGVQIVILKAGKIDIEIWEDKTQAVPEQPGTPLMRMGVNHIALAVNRLEPVIEKMQQHGYAIIKGIYTVTRGIREAIILGPDNLEIQFVEQNIPILVWRSITGDLKAIRPKE